MEKGSFIFRKEWKNAISGLPDDVRLEIYEAIIDYGTTGNMPKLRPMAKLAFNFTREFIDKDKSKYESICERRREYGKKGGLAKATKSKQELAKASKSNTGKQKLASVADNDIDNDMSSSNEEQNKKKTTKVVKKDAASAAALLEKRKDDFYKSLVPFVEIYGKDMVRDFFNYWTEANKSRTRMRFEQQPTWETSKRLLTWCKKENNYGHGKRSETTPESRASEVADIIARRNAEDAARS